MARRSGCVVNWLLAGTGLHPQHNRVYASVPCCLRSVAREMEDGEERDEDANDEPNIFTQRDAPAVV